MGDQYNPPQGPPPGYHSHLETFQSGSRDPHHAHQSGAGNRSHELASNNPFRKDQYTPPPEPPTSHQDHEPEPPPYDPWLAVPDSTLLPPPPSVFEEQSPAANASYDDAAKAHAWCRQNPIWLPKRHSQPTIARMTSGDIQLTAPPDTKSIRIWRTGVGETHVRTTNTCKDTIFLSDTPLYIPSGSLPRTIYYELKVLSVDNSGDSGIAIGFLAPPYPSWRLPGWHRASLAVHGDDGRRYVDNSYGGQEFTSSFSSGDVVGIGMVFSAPIYRGGKNTVAVFFTRNGRKEGGWDLHEERDRDREEGDVFGLEGMHDILAAVGCFGRIEFEVRFRDVLWMSMS